MRNRFLAVCCVLAVMIFFSNTAFAQDELKFGVGVDLSYYQMSDDSLDALLAKDALPTVAGNNPASYGEVDYDATAYWGGNATCFFNEYFSAVFSLGYSKTNVDVDHIVRIDKKLYTTGIELGEVAQVPMSITGRVHIPTGTLVTPYIAGGFGYIWNNFDQSGSYLDNVEAMLEKLDNGVPAAITKSDLKELLGYEVDDDWEFHLGCGVEINATDNVAIVVDGKYMWHSSDLGNTYGSTDMEMNAFTMGAGVKYYF